MNTKDKQQLCLKASQKTELRTLLELSAASSAGKNYVNQKKRHIHLNNKNRHPSHTHKHSVGTANNTKIAQKGDKYGVTLAKKKYIYKRSLPRCHTGDSKKKKIKAQNATL